MKKSELRTMIKEELKDIDVWVNKVGEYTMLEMECIKK